MDIFDDVDDKLFVFNSLFLDTLHHHAPAGTIRVKRNRAPWITKSIQDEMDKRNKLQRRLLSTRSLPSVSKILERHVKEHLSNHLESNNLLYSHQSGFRSGHSTASFLLYCTDRWYNALDHRQYVAVLFLDVSKAFDTVNHSLILSKFQHLGLSDSCLSWFQSYISNRSQVTSISGVHSSLGFPMSSVPQGSVLDPTLLHLHK